MVWHVVFVDNMTALKICVNGYGRHADIAHLFTNAIHLALAGLSSRVYVEWVPGKANPADLPSRADFIAGPATGLLSLTLSISKSGFRQKINFWTFETLCFGLV